MADVLPKGSFSKLGLSAGALRNAFSSLTSSLTTLRSDIGGSGLTERRVEPEVVGQSETGNWDIYMSSPDHPWVGENGNGTIVSKQVKHLRESLVPESPPSLKRWGKGQGTPD